LVRFFLSFLSSALPSGIHVANAERAPEPDSAKEADLTLIKVPMTIPASFIRFRLAKMSYAPTAMGPETNEDDESQPGNKRPID
jgi:hypothetical protein